MHNPLHMRFVVMHPGNKHLSSFILNPSHARPLSPMLSLSLWPA
jgi:hypothetical protein